MKLIAFLLIQAMPLMAQTAKAKDVPAGTLASFTLAELPPSATWSDFIKDGVYRAEFNDPTNKFRCHVGGIVDAGINGITAFTVVCAKIEDVPDLTEKPKAKK